MKLAALFNSEIEQLVSRQIYLNALEVSDEELSNILSSLFIDDHFYSLNEVKRSIRKNPVLSGMEDLSLIYTLMLDFSRGELSHFNLTLISDRLKEHPGHKLFTYLWIAYRIQLWSDEEFDLEIAFLLNDVLRDHPYLVRLDDFFENSFFPTLNEERIQKYPKLLLPVFEQSIQDYRGKMTLYYHLALCFLYSGERDRAFGIYRFIKKRLLDWNVDYTEIAEDYFTFRHFSRLIIEIVKDLESIEAYSRINVMLEEINLIFFNQFNKNDDDYYYTGFFIEIFFRRMRANVHLGDFAEMRRDYHSIEPYLGDVKFKFWNTKFRDVMTKINKTVNA